MIKVNAMGDACPIPVIKTKKAMDSLNSSDIVEVLVDNEIAVQNLTKLGNSRGCTVKSEKIGEKEFRVEIHVEVSGTEEGAPDTAEEVCIPDSRKKNMVVVIASDCMGSGDDTLGKALMKGFIYALTKQDELPSTILFYNGGAKLTCEDAPTLEDLKSMEAQGVEILTCGTCLNHYGLSEKLQVGSVTNMYVIVEKMTKASLIVKP